MRFNPPLRTGRLVVVLAAMFAMLASLLLPADASAAPGQKSAARAASIQLQPAGPVGAAKVIAEDYRVRPNGRVVATFSVDAAAHEIASGQFWITYDPSIVTPVQGSIGNDCTKLHAGTTLFCVHDALYGQIGVAWIVTSTTEGIGGQFELLEIEFEAVGPLGSQTPLDVADVELFKFSGEPVRTLDVDGSITIGRRLISLP